MSIFKKASVAPIVRTVISQGLEEYEDMALINAAREWAKDNQWQETEEDPENNFIDNISPKILLKLVDRHYEGGLDQLRKDWFF